jgi:integral membrane protein
MNSPRTTPTSPGSLNGTGVRTSRVTTWLVGYRIAAYATGVMLLVLTAHVVLHYGFHDRRLAWSAPVHGFLYLGYFACTIMLGTSMRWRPGRMVLVALAGMIPLMSFVAERSVTREVRSRSACPADSNPGQPW